MRFTAFRLTWLDSREEKIPRLIISDTLQTGRGGTAARMTMNDFLTAPVFDHVLLTNGLVLFAIFLLLLRFLPDFARHLTLLLVSLALIEIATSPFYVFLFTALTGCLYYGLFWLQWSKHKKVYSFLISCGLVILYFLLLDLPAFQTPWTGPMVHRFGVAYSLFRLLSVTLDVGRGRPLPADPLDFFVYAFFAPTFFQGPIESLEEFRKNLSSPPPLKIGDMGSHIIRIVVACLKGWVALRFFELDWKEYFDHPQRFSYGFLVWGLYARAISFYLFVSAANDLTIGCCAVAGYRLSENFDYPYFKKNLAEFWRSWHMTLFRFLREYIYIPLGGNRRHVYLNYLIVFMAAALWHVTSKAFILWGLWHGVGMCILKLWQNFWKNVETTRAPTFFRAIQLRSRDYPRCVALASTLVTFHYVALGWLPFWGGHPQGLSLILRLISGNRWRLFLWD